MRAMRTEAIGPASAKLAEVDNKLDRLRELCDEADSIATTFEEATSSHIQAATHQIRRAIEWEDEEASDEYRAAVYPDEDEEEEDE